MNAAFRMLYRGGAWLDASEASEIARHGLLHLRAFKHLAALSLGLKEPRFPLHVKAHRTRPLSESLHGFRAEFHRKPQCIGHTIYTSPH